MSHAGGALAQPRRLTRRGRATRDRTVRAAGALVYGTGVNGTTLDDVRTASGTSKSQLYRHFADKESLELWRDDIVRRNALRNGAYGCELGSFAAELADHDEVARTSLNDHFTTWQGLLRAGLTRVIDKGVLRSDADPEVLAIGLTAAVHGGYLLAQTARDVAPMKAALDMALERVKSYATAPPA